jgi:hypothetical protein
LRLLNDAPIFAEDAGVLMAYGFKEAASEEFDEVLVKHDDASSEELWDSAGDKALRRRSDRSNRTVFSNADLGAHESVKSYSLRPEEVGASASGSPHGRGATSAFRHRAVAAQRKDASLVPGLYEQVVSRMVGLDMFRRRKLEPLRPSKETVAFADGEGGWSTRTRELWRSTWRRLPR